MKICWLIPDDRGGGVASVALSCVRQAPGTGHEATLLLALAASGWINYGGSEGFTVDSLEIEPLASEAPTTILRWLGDHPQDVLVLNGCEEADTVIPYLPANLRCVYVVHDTASRYWHTAITHESDLDAIVAVSHVVANRFRKLLREPEKVRIIHNGSFFPPPPTAPLERPNDLLFVGGSNPMKGAHDVLRLWKMLLSQGFEGNLHWIGQLTPDIERHVRAVPKPERIHLRGQVSREEIFETAARCKVFLMLSYVESFGMATLEAMSMGCVPVAWDVDTGTREIVKDGSTGLFAPLGDFSALAHQVRRVVSEHNRLAPGAIDDARGRFSEKEMWAGYSRLLEEMATRPFGVRSRAGETPPPYRPPRRHLQRIPVRVRRILHALIGASPRIGHWLRNLRGW